MSHPPLLRFSEAYYANALYLAFELAVRSPDPSTQNGAVILDHRRSVIGSAFNTFPEGVMYLPERWERPGKYQWIEHAERGAIYDAARQGHKTLGTTMVCPWAACADCARGIVVAGIARLVRLAFPMDGSGERWRQSCEVGDRIMIEGGIEIVEFDGEYKSLPILRNGEIWEAKSLV